MEGLILHRSPYGEADSILEVLTAEAGKFSVIAKHARVSRRRFGPALDYFNVLDITVRQGRGGLAFLEEAHLVSAYAGLRSEMERLESAYALLASLRSAVREGQPEVEKYHLLKGSLDLVSRSPAYRAVRPAFQLRLLVLAGVGPNFSACSECGGAVRPERMGEIWRLVWERGGIVCPPCNRGFSRVLEGLAIPVPVIRWMESASREGPLEDNLRSAPLTEVLKAADQCIQYYLL